MLSWMCVCITAHAMFPLIQHVRRLRAVQEVGVAPLAVHRLDTGGVGKDTPGPAELPGRPPRRSGEGETRAFKCSPSMSVAARCTRSHMSLCKSHTTIRVSLCKSHTTVRVCIYICMYVYKSFRQSETAPVHHRRSRRSLPLGRRRDSCI